MKYITLDLFKSTLEKIKTIYSAIGHKHNRNDIVDFDTHYHYKKDIADFPESLPADGGSADKLKTAHTINVSGAVTGTALSFDGTSDVNIPVNSVKHTSVTWDGDPHTSDQLGFTEAALIPELGANRFFGITQGVTITYSNDGGETWLDYGATQQQICNFFSNGDSLYVFKDKDYTNPEKHLLRITIDTSSSDTGAHVYTELLSLYIYTNLLSSKGAYVILDVATQKNPDNFINVINKVSLTGWSGGNYIPIPNIQTYGQNAGQKRYLRFTFGCTGFDDAAIEGGLIITNLKAFGGMAWEYPTLMAKKGVPYSIFMGNNAQTIVFNQPNATLSADNYTGKVNGYTINANVPAGAEFTDTVYTLPTATSSALGGIKSATADTRNDRTYNVYVDSSGIGYVRVPWTNTTYNAATTSADGLMSSSDKSKLDKIKSANIELWVERHYTPLEYNTADYGDTSYITGTGIKTILYNSGIPYFDCCIGDGLGSYIETKKDGIFIYKLTGYKPDIICAWPFINIGDNIFHLVNSCNWYKECIVYKGEIGGNINVTESAENTIVTKLTPYYIFITKLGSSDSSWYLYGKPIPDEAPAITGDYMESPDPLSDYLIYELIEK